MLLLHCKDFTGGGVCVCFFNRGLQRIMFPSLLNYHAARRFNLSNCRTATTELLTIILRNYFRRARQMGLCQVCDFFYLFTQRK